MPKSSKGTDPYQELDNLAAPKTSEALAAVERHDAQIKAATLPKSDALKLAGRREALSESAFGGSTSDPYSAYEEMVAQPAVNDSPAELMMVATAQINVLIARAEVAIHLLGFHVTGRVLLAEDDASDWTQWLRFGKEGKQWRLTVESGPANDLDAWTSVSLHTTSRETRLKALRLLPQLVDELSGRAEREARAAMKIVSDAQEFIASLERMHQ
jgi:hypothetical protein